MPYKDPEQKRLQNRRRYLEKREEILAKNREYFIENRDSVFLCTDCDEHATEYHHPNYDYPLWIEPLCSKCHLAIHGKQSINLLK
jgi:hypothetical protein